MNTTLAARWIFLATLTLLLLSCSGKGDDVVDPKSGDRKEMAFVAVEGNGGDDLTRFNEAAQTADAGEYAKSNGAPLGKTIDAIFEANERLYLHHRGLGEISVLDLKTRKLIGTITGFPNGTAGALCGMAFSNVSQAWGICYGSNNLYLIDAINLNIARIIPLPGNPTAVGTVKNKVFVGMVMPDGSAKVAVFSSNGGEYPIEHQLDMPTAPIYIFGNPDGQQMVVLTSGNPGTDTAIADDDVRPVLHYILLSTMSVDGVSTIEVPSLDRYIGQEPNFAARTKDYLLYIATPIGVSLAETAGRGVFPLWLPGDFRVLGADYYSSMVYIYDPATASVRRLLADATEYTPTTFGGAVRAVQFVNANSIQ
jgi:hypothetical protein